MNSSLPRVEGGSPSSICSWKTGHSFHVPMLFSLTFQEKQNYIIDFFLRYFDVSLKLYLCHLATKTQARSISANFHSSTVDGRNPAPVDMVNTPLLEGFHTCQVVVWDIFHQQ